MSARFSHALDATCPRWLSFPFVGVGAAAGGPAAAYAAYANASGACPAVFESMDKVGAYLAGIPVSDKPTGPCAVPNFPGARRAAGGGGGGAGRGRGRAAGRAAGAPLPRKDLRRTRRPACNALRRWPYRPPWARACCRRPVPTRPPSLPPPPSPPAPPEYKTTTACSAADRMRDASGAPIALQAPLAAVARQASVRGCGGGPLFALDAFPGFGDLKCGPAYATPGIEVVMNAGQFVDTYLDAGLLLDALALAGGDASGAGGRWPVQHKWLDLRVQANASHFAELIDAAYQRDAAVLQQLKLVRGTALN
jgi:hypothetical protein